MIYFNLFIKIQKGLIFGQDFVKDSISLKNLLKKKNVGKILLENYLLLSR